MKEHAEANRRFRHPVCLSLALGALLLTAAVGLAACSDLAAPEESPEAVASQSATPDGAVFTEVDDMPKLEGGIAGLMKKVHYPAAAREAGVEGRVLVRFVVDENGAVTNPTVLKSPDDALGAEALRVTKQAEFKPGRQNGHPAKVKLTLPFTFKLPGHQSTASAPADSTTAFIESVDVRKDRTPPEIRIQTKPGTPEAIKARIRQSTQASQKNARVIVK